jgi:hypothetical protein
MVESFDLLRLLLASLMRGCVQTWYYGVPTDTRRLKHPKVLVYAVLT